MPEKIDVKTCGEGTIAVAQVFYRRYCENADNKNYRGEECPSWDALTDKIRSHWCAVADLAVRGTMVTIREFVDMRLDHMAARPMMWASTKESLGVQLVLLAEMIVRTLPEMASGLAHTAELTHRLWGPGSVVPQEPVDAAWATTAVAITRSFLDEKCPKT